MRSLSTSFEAASCNAEVLPDIAAPVPPAKANL